MHLFRFTAFGWQMSVGIHRAWGLRRIGYGDYQRVVEVGPIIVNAHRVKA